MTDKDDVWHSSFSTSWILHTVSFIKSPVPQRCHPASQILKRQWRLWLVTTNFKYGVNCELMSQQYHIGWICVYYRSQTIYRYGRYVLTINWYIIRTFPSVQKSTSLWHVKLCFIGHLRFCLLSADHPIKNVIKGFSSWFHDFATSLFIIGQNISHRWFLSD